MDMVWWHSNVLDELLALHWRSSRLQVERRRKTNKVQVVPTDRWPLPHKGGHSLQPLEMLNCSLYSNNHISTHGRKWDPQKYEWDCFHIGFGVGMFFIHSFNDDIHCQHWHLGGTQMMHTFIWLFVYEDGSTQNRDAAWQVVLHVWVVHFVWVCSGCLGHFGCLDNPQWTALIR